VDTPPGSDFPRRGEIYWIDFNPRRGSEQGGVRPAAVVSNDIINQHGPTVIVAALTRTIPSTNYPQNVHLPAGSPLADASTILCAQLLTVSKTRLQRHYGTLSESQMPELDRALSVALGLAREIPRVEGREETEER
jgi:mRNA interferase MazF